MAPSEQRLIEKLKATVKAVYLSDERTDLTVRLIRDKVEEELGLEKGFFVREAWKDKSKGIIKGYASEILAMDEAGGLEQTKERTPPPLKKAIPAKKRTKEAGLQEKARPRKKQKKEVTPSDETSELSDLPDEETPVSEIDEEDLSDPPKSKRGSNKKAPVKRKNNKRKVDSDENEDEDEFSEESFGDEEDSDAKPARKKSTPKKPTPKKPTPKKPTPKSNSGKKRLSKASANSDSEVEVSKYVSDEDEPPASKKAKPKAGRVVDSEEDEEESTPAKKVVSKSPAKPPSKPIAEKQDEKAKTKANDSDSEMSVVIDITPKKKQKRRSKSEMAANVEPKTKPKPTKTKAVKTKAAPKPQDDLSPTEAQIKTLQSQLVKCGVRKIWQFELKQFEDDNKAKVRYLQNMLKDIGMQGRFSDARAREIKEIRELQADVEAVVEGEKSWGMESGRRARSKTKKNFQETVISDDEDDEEDGVAKKTRVRSTKSGSRDGSESESDAPRSRVPRAKQDLAFLGDEEDSDD